MNNIKKTRRTHYVKLSTHKDQDIGISCFFAKQASDACGMSNMSTLKLFLDSKQQSNPSISVSI